MLAHKNSTLGIIAISHNEERDMPRFLEHLLPWVDEIVIVDDGSTDQTVEIVKAAGPKVKLVEHLRDKEHGFAGQRNKGIEVATSEWLLHLDIDMRVPPELALEICQVIQDSTKQGYYFWLLDFFLHRPLRGAGIRGWNQPRLARRGKHNFKNRVHEVCLVQASPEEMGQLQAPMWHLNDEDYVERIGKNMRYSQIEANKIIDTGFKVRWYHFLIQPLKRSVKAYLLQGGFRDGTLGLLRAVYVFCGTFNWYACAWDKQNRIERDVLESELIKKWERTLTVLAKTNETYLKLVPVSSSGGKK